MKKARSIPPKGSTCAVKRRIQRTIRQIDVLAGQLRSIQDELEVPDFQELEEMCTGQRLWSYEALLLGLLCLMDFHLAEATVSLWRESWAKYPPSQFDGDMYDPDLARAVLNWIDRKEEGFRAEARTQPLCPDFLDGVYEVRIERDGFLSLPEDLADGLDFREGDDLALDPGPASVGIESHREFLSALDVVAEGGLRARLRSQFLDRPKTVVGPGCTIEVPAELMPLRAGRTARLQVLNRGMTREVYLLRDEANA